MPFKCQMSYQAFRGFKTSLQWSEPWCLHSFTYRPRKIGFVCFCFEHCSNTQEIFFFIFQERNYFVKQRKLHFVLFRTWHFHINLSKYIYSSVFWYRARNLFFPPSLCLLIGVIDYISYINIKMCPQFPVPISWNWSGTRRTTFQECESQISTFPPDF